VSSLCLVGVAVYIWLVSHAQKVDYQGLSKEVFFLHHSCSEWAALQLPSLQRGALREWGDGCGWNETLRNKVTTSLGYVLSLVLAMVNAHHVALVGCISGGFKMEQQLL